MAAMAFCWEPPCCAPGGHVGCGWCRWWKLWAVGEEGGIQAAWWPGGDEAQKGLKFAGGEQATADMGPLPLCKPSDARSLENMASASGKLGGVAGVLLGVHICWERTRGLGEGYRPAPRPHLRPRQGLQVRLPPAGPSAIPILQSPSSFDGTRAPSHPEPMETRTNSNNFYQHQRVS